jgi:hypothetical protein
VYITVVAAKLVEHPVREVIQADGRIRRWAPIPGVVETKDLDKKRADLPRFSFEHVA